MTREEAHRILSNGLVNAPSEHEWCMAFDMAIKALEQEPREIETRNEKITKLNRRFNAVRKEEFYVKIIRTGGPEDSATASSI